MFTKKLTADQLAFGRIPAYRKYELFMERYRSAADDFITPHIENLESAKLLDVGSGNGSLKYFISNKKAVDFVGIELDPKRIENCKKMGYSQIESFNIEKEKFTFPDNSFDVVVAMHIVEHLYHPENGVKEMLRVLKKDGILIIGVPMHIPPIAWLQRLKEKLFPAKWWEHHQFYTLRSLVKFLSPYNIIDVRGFRLISSRRRFAWEDNMAFYKFNTWWGRKFPGLSSEVNIVLKK